MTLLRRLNKFQIGEEVTLICFVKIWPELFRTIHRKRAAPGSSSRIASIIYRKQPRWKPTFRKVRGCRPATLTKKTFLLLGKAFQKSYFVEPKVPVQFQQQKH